MSRFGHLEFDDGKRQSAQASRPEARPQTGTPPATAEGYLLQADEEYRWGRYESALRLYTRCLEESRAMVPAWVGQVQMLIQMGEYHEARLWSDKALELFHNNGDLLAAKAQACVRLKEKRAAFACSDASLQAGGSSPYRWAVRGEVLMAHRQGTYQACFKRAMTEPAACWFDCVVVAGIYLFYGKWASALEHATEATNRQPQHAYCWFVLGNCQRELGMKPMAVTSYGRCLELRPDYRPAQAAIDAMDNESFLARLFRRLRG